MPATEGRLFGPGFKGAPSPRIGPRSYTLELRFHGTHGTPNEEIQF